MRQTTATFSRRRLQNSSVENAPYKPGDVVADRYEIKDVVGAGPVGFVFRAADRQVDVEVALKVITPRLVQTPDERRQFAKAIRLGRKLSHQNLIRVYEEGEDQDRPFFTMQFLEGLTLRKIIDLRAQKNEYFALREIEPILGQIAHALDGAHKVGAHSNLKPENVIVLPDLLKVADFGLALAIPHLPFVQAAKQRKADRYLAPEYVQGHEVDQRADLYSLGVIIGEMLSGLTPDGAIPELARRNPEVPPQLEGLYRKALNSNPLARPKTATELFQEFAEITRRVSPPPLKKGPEAPAPAVSRSRPAMAPPLAASSSATETVEFRRRVVEKPPPPVPDIESIEVPINGNSHEELSPDATQPISSSSIPVPPPPPDDAHETLVMPAVVEPELLPELVGEPTESRPIPGTERSSRAGVWFFVMFTLLGLSLGAAGGYWLLKRSRQPAQPIAMPGPGTDGAATGATGATGISGTTGAVVAAGPNGPTGGTGPNLQLDPGGQPNADPGAAEKQRAEEAKRLAEERKKIDDAATAAAQKNELLRVQEEKRKAEEARKAAEAERLAEERRLAEENRKAEEAAAKLAEQKRRAEEKKPETVAAAAVAPKPGCPDGMKLIHAGSFKMGTARNDPMMGFDEKILASTSVSAFCIDYYEYPNRRGATPKVGVSWTEAKRSCEARGKRLCSEEEWEKACKGPGNARYPYGNTYDADACNTEDELGEDRPLATSGRFSKCRSGYGIADMSGNAAEWTASAYAGNADKAQKGGSFSKPDYAARCSARKNGSPGSRGSDVGFRCCADP